MADVKFKCPHCSQNLEAPDDMGGEAIECPSCNKNITIPAPAPAEEAASGGKEWRMPRKRKRGQDAPAAGKEEGETCPGCDAPLAADAVLCVKCGLNLQTGKKISTNL